MRTALWALLASSLVILSACGRVGTLEQPAPLWGEKAKAEYQAKKAAAEAAKAAAKDDGQVEPLAPDTPGMDAPKARIPTLRDTPAPGAPSLPNASAPAGALPDPYSHPQ